MFENQNPGAPTRPETARRAAGKAQSQPQSKTTKKSKRPLYRLRYFGSKYNYGVRGKLAEYCRLESSTVEITHQSNTGQRPYNIFWLRTYGLDSWCVETELDQAQVLELLERDAARIRAQYAAVAAR